MAEEDEIQEDQEEIAAFEEAVTSEDDQEEEGVGEAAEEEQLDPLAEEMMKIMEEEGEEKEEKGGGEDVDRMMEMEMLKAMEAEGGIGGMEAAESGLAGVRGKPAGGEGIPPNISRLMDVPLMVTIELGRAEATLEEVMSYGEQSLVELDKQVGDPVDILVNGKLFARGEVVVVSENFGVRITEILHSVANL